MIRINLLASEHRGVKPASKLDTAKKITIAGSLLFRPDRKRPRVAVLGARPAGGHCSSWTSNRLSRKSSGSTRF